MTPVTVAALELPHRFGDRDGQLRRADALLSAAGKVDLAVLPECAFTGYVSSAGAFDLTRFAEPLDGPMAQAIAQLARTHGTAIAAPVIEREGTVTYNAFLVVDRSGARLAHYRKRHPWYPETWATPGNLGTPVFELAGLRATLAICFDLHFLESDADAELGAADLLIFPSAWVTDAAIDERDLRLPELARRFELSIVNANWGAGTPAVRGQGASRILDPQGHELARAANGLAVATFPAH